MYNECIAKSLTKSYREDMDVSHEWTIENTHKRSWFIRFKESIQGFIEGFLSV